MIGASPDVLPSLFTKTDAKWFRVDFPQPPYESIEYQRETVTVCSDDKFDRIGSSPLGRFDSPIETTVKVISSWMKKSVDALPLEKRSPALDFLRTFSIDMNAMQDLFDVLVEQGVDVNFDEAHLGQQFRAAVCDWVYKNVETIEQSLPHGFPREFEEQEDVVLMLVAMTTSISAFCFVFCMALLTYRFRHHEAVYYSQIVFLQWMIAGENVNTLKHFIQFTVFD